ncbi:hypothetical protein C7C46_32440 [Streptomyces tateyamensis]|uniref:Uncharacterized protein n=1 Tax=Streptomyces tateyamensis TaxID=565073 RepID=A0A2V4MZN2_9ACTN|nr:hypothetical protein C7C46_32440 [Streptomyces tateyamensis]
MRHADCPSLVRTAGGHPVAPSGLRQSDFGCRAAGGPASDAASPARRGTGVAARRRTAPQKRNGPSPSHR